MTKPVSAATLRRTFLVALVLGTIPIAFGGRFQGGQFPVLMQAAAVAVMLGYGFWVWYRTRLLYNVEQIADSLYYLGFLFTLMALLFNLVPGLSGAPDAPNTAMVLQRFGLALVTTIVGMGGRLYLIQFRREIADEEQEIHDQIAAAVHRLAHELDLSVGYLKDASAQVSRTFIESANVAITSINDVASTASEALEKTAKAKRDATAEQIDEAILTFQDAIGKSAESMQRFTDDTIGQTRRIIGNLESKLDSIEPPDDLFSGVRNMLGELEQSIEQTTAIIGGHAQSWNELILQIRDSVEGLKGLDSRIDGAQDMAEHMIMAKNAAQNLSTSLQDLNGAIRINLTAFEKHGKDVSIWSAGISDEFEAVRNYRDQMQQAVEQANQATLKVLDHLEENVRFIKAELK